MHRLFLFLQGNRILPKDLHYCRAAKHSRRFFVGFIAFLQCFHPDLDQSLIQHKSLIVLVIEIILLVGNGSIITVPIYASSLQQITGRPVDRRLQSHFSEIFHRKLYHCG